MSAAYQEHRPPAELKDLVACMWESDVVGDYVQRVIPDGCVDLIWLAGCRLEVAGADTGPRSVSLPAGARSSGIRLRPGAAGRVLGVPATEVRDRGVAACELWGDHAARLEEALASSEPARHLDLLANAVAERGARRDALVAAAAARLARPGARVAAVAGALGVSERMLHRRTVAAVGYGPKILARVARLRRLIASAEGSLPLRALDAGYASQSHASDEVRCLTGMTLVRFLEDAVLTAA